MLLWSSFLYAQNDSSGKKNDSINTAILKNYSRKIAGLDSQRRADSVKQIELQLRLSSLSTKDNGKKTALQNQLQALEDKKKNQFLQKKIQIDALRKTAKAYPVSGFFEDTLFVVYSRLGSFSAKERADAITNRIGRLGENFGYTADSLRIARNETSTDVIYGENIITTVTENDALWNNTTADSLASTYRTVISSAVKKYKQETSLATLAKEIGLALLVIVIIGALIFYIIKFFRWTAAKIEEQQNKRIKGVKIKDYMLFDAARQVNVLLKLNTIIKWLIILLAAYITLPILFGIFPWTKDFAETLFGYILSPVRRIARAVWHFLPNLITIIVIVVVFRYVLKGIRFLKDEIENGHLTLQGFYPDWANPTYQIVRILIFAFMVVVIFPYLPGSDSPVFKGVSVFLGFLFTFGSAGSLSNIIAGLILTYMRLFKIGDRVKISDVSGDVIEKSLLVTRIRTIKNEIISIPNSTVMNSHTINYSSDAPDKGLIIHTTVTIGYDVPWRNMHQVLIDAAQKTALVLPEPKPFVLQTSLDDFYVSYQVNAYVREAGKQAVIYSELHSHIQDICNERGIEIMSPHYRAARDGSTTTIPSTYLPDDYHAPGFNVRVKKDDNGQ